MCLAEGEDDPPYPVLPAVPCRQWEKRPCSSGFGRGQLRGRKEISFPIALVGCQEEGPGGNGEKLRCPLHLGGPYLLSLHGLFLCAPPTTTCPAARKRCPLFSVASTDPMPTAGQALFSWRVLVADDYEERRHLPRNSRRLPGSRSQIFIERGERRALYLWEGGSLFFRDFFASTCCSYRCLALRCEEGMPSRPYADSG